MSFFSEEELTSLHITNMSLHVVGGETFTPQTQRDVEHEAFFIARIQGIDVDPVYTFNDESDTKSRLERIAVGHDTFEIGVQGLAREFSRFHVTTTRDGAFFVFELSTDQADKKIYCLVKYDYHEVIEQADLAEGGVLRRIVNAFVADKKAIQKSALIRVVNGRAELPLSTRDRMKPSPEIGDYFAKFLDVTRTLSDAELNVKLKDVLQNTLTQWKQHLPDRSVPQAFKRAKTILRDRQEVNEDAIFDAILMAAGNPQDEGLRADLQKLTTKKIKAAKLEGLEFRPDRNILSIPPTRKLKTTEGVTIYYPDEAAVVERTPTQHGGEKITIHTERITEDTFVRNTPS